MAGRVADVEEAAAQPTRIALGARRRGRDGFWFRFRSQPGALIGIAVLALLLSLALFAAAIAPGDPFATSRQVFLPPSASHPFGTDDLGRDLYRSVIHGARASLIVGVATTLIATFIGIFVGACAGYFGGWADDVLMRLTELFQLVPRFF